MDIVETDGVIKELSTWDMPDTVSKPDGYDSKTLPEATADNMMVLMNKINELVRGVNDLDRLARGTIQALKRN